MGHKFEKWIMQRAERLVEIVDFLCVSNHSFPLPLDGVVRRDDLLLLTFGYLLNKSTHTHTHTSDLQTLEAIQDSCLRVIPMYMLRMFEMRSCVAWYLDCRIKMILLLQLEEMRCM